VYDVNVSRTATSGAPLVSIDHFAHELISQLRSATERGATTVVITCGELCKSIRDAGRWTQACCDAMQAEIKPDDVVLVEQGSGSGMTVIYRLPRQ
jgi:hypothetical protein